MKTSVIKTCAGAILCLTFSIVSFASGGPNFTVENSSINIGTLHAHIMKISNSNINSGNWYANQFYAYDLNYFGNMHLHLSDKFVNHGALVGYSLHLDAPNIHSDKDPNLGVICWKKSFVLNGHNVTTHDKRCS